MGRGCTARPFHRFHLGAGMSIKHFVVGVAAAALGSAFLTITGTPEADLGPAAELSPTGR
ncbi:hypothetical protein GCM10027456_09940 [Kineosporia babensis]